MKKTILLSLLALFFWAASGSAQSSAPPAAAVILKEAFTRAKESHRNVILIFHASWCGWCHRMDAAMADSAIKRYFDDNYVICHLDVLEQDDKKYLENEGAEKLLADYKGGQQGVPFWVIMDKDGKVLADSKLRRPGQNIGEGSNMGCPAQKLEVSQFVSDLRKTSNLKAPQLAVIYTRFRENDRKFDHHDQYEPASK